MATFTKIHLMLALLFSSSAILVQAGGILGCFGCGWAFPCNPFECRPSGNAPRRPNDYVIYFEIDTIAASDPHGIPSIPLDRNVNAAVHNNVNNGNLVLTVQATPNFPHSAHVTYMSFQFGRVDPIQLRGPDLIRGAQFSVSGHDVNYQITSTGQTKIRCTVVYELEGELK